MTSKETNSALIGIRLGASNIVVAYFKVKQIHFLAVEYFQCYLGWSK